MFLYIRIGIREVDFARFRSHIGKCIENVGEVVNREIPRVVAMTVDCLKYRRRIFPLAAQGTRTQFTKHDTGRYPFRQVSASFSRRTKLGWATWPARTSETIADQNHLVWVDESGCDDK